MINKTHPMLLRLVGLSFVLCVLGENASASTVNAWNPTHVPLPLLAVKKPANIFVTLDDSCSMWTEWTIPQGQVNDIKKYNHVQSYEEALDEYYLYDGNNDTTEAKDLTFPDTYFDPWDYIRTRMIHMFTHIVQRHGLYQLDWRRLSPNVFELYYNPSKTYHPWGHDPEDSTAGFPDADFNSVRLFPGSLPLPEIDNPNPNNGVPADELYDLSESGGFRYYIHLDTRNRTQTSSGLYEMDTYTSVNYSESDPIGLADITTVDLWDDHVEYIVQNDKIIKRRINFENNISPISCVANSSYKQTPPYSDCLDAEIKWEVEVTEVFGRTLAEEKQNIANWFQYHRHPMAQSKDALYRAITKRPNLNWGAQLMADGGYHPPLTLSDNTKVGQQARVFIPIPPGNSDLNAEVARADQAQTVLSALLGARDAPDCTTSTLQATQRAGRYFDTSNPVSYRRNDGSPGGEFTITEVTSPIAGACQQNFHLLVTDGVWTRDYASVGDANNDGESNTLSDIAKYYRDTDLASSLDNLVPTITYDADRVATDTGLTHQHLSQYIIGLNFLDHPADGDDLDIWPDAALTDPANFDWWLGNNIDDSRKEIENLAKVNDHWRAAYDSDGLLIPSTDARTALAAAFDDIDTRISDRYYGASSIPDGIASSGDENKVFTTRFNTNTYTTELLTIEFNSDGSFKENGVTTTPLRLPQNRKVFTNDGNNAIDFDAANLSADQKETLIQGVDSLEEADNQTKDNYIEDLVNYIRGDQSQEGDGENKRGWRVRANTATPGNAGAVTVGAIGHSNLVYVGTPPNRYPSGWPEGTPENNLSYDAFRSSVTNRSTMLYFGSTDGMLHGFNLNSGNAVLSYVPEKLHAKLHTLTQPDPFFDNAFVDGKVTVRDAVITHSGNPAWRTLLVGGLRTGGQGIFALDVTNPNATPGELFQWEFTDADDSDLGNVAGFTNIVRLNNGRWGVVLGNGYNNTAADSHPSTTGNAVIYILDAETGALIKKFDTGIGFEDDPNNPSKERPNGIINVSAVNTFVRGNLVDYTVDLLYAGDLFGNLWKIDISKDNPNQWAFMLGSGHSSNTVNRDRDDGEPLLAIPPDENDEPISITAPLSVSYRNVRKPEQGLILNFGTGQYIAESDNAESSFGPNYFFGLIDKGLSAKDRGSASDDSQTINFTSDLVEQTICTAAGGSCTAPESVTYEGVRYEVRYTTTNPVDLDSDNPPNLGWYLTLDESEGERVTSAPIFLQGTVFFVTFIPETNDCTAGGSSYIMRLDAETGHPTNAVVTGVDPLASQVPTGIRDMGDNLGYKGITLKQTDEGFSIVPVGQGGISGEEQTNLDLNELDLGQDTLISR